MATIPERVIEIAVVAGLANRAKCLPGAAIQQDLGINGDEGDEFVNELCREFGDWIADWPWARFVDFNEPPAGLGPKIWKWLRLPNPHVAFPGYVKERLELMHIAAAIENGEWFDP
jgi:hypothetical protein